MKNIRLSLATLLIAACAGSAQAQPATPSNAPADGYQPTPGQAGKDVIWLPTPQIVVDKMLEVARVGPSDVVMDLGSGDGRTVITAARLGARAMGIEYNADMVEFAKRSAAAAGVSARASFVKADLFETSFAEASVITMFLLPRINLELRPKILALKPGTRIVSNTFTMGEWEPDSEIDLAGQPGCNSSYCRVLFWLVPRQVAGSYATPLGQVVLRQEFQMLSGSLTTGGTMLEVKGRVMGEDIEISAGGKRYRGMLKGSALELREAG